LAITERGQGNMQEVEEHDVNVTAVRNGFTHITGFLDGIVTWSKRIGMWLILPIIGCMVFEIISRYVFNAPTIWSTAITTQLFGANFILCGGYAILLNKHIRVDIVYERYSPRIKAILDSIVSVFRIFVCYFFIKFAWIYFSTAITTNGVLVGHFSPPLWPIKGILAISSVLLALGVVSRTIKTLYFAVKGVEL